MHLRASSSLPPQPPPIPEQQEKLFEFLHTQKKIRALIDLTGNFGNQAATYNLIKRLRVLGFEGRIELIYFKSVKAKIMQLFDLNEHSEDSYYCANSAIEFIEFDLFLQKAQAGAIQPLALGLTGAMDSKPSQWASLIPNDNYADFLKVGAFVRFSPYYNMLDLCNTEIYLSGKKKPLIQEASCSKMLLTPSASFFEVQEYLVSNTKGKALAARYPALQTLLSYIDSGTINFQPLYGWTLRESPSNLLNIILGARFAQVQGGAAFRKPLVMGAFFNLRHNNFFLESLNLNISNLDLLKFTLENSWGCYDTYPGAAEVKKVSRDLNLKKALKIA